MSYKPKVLDVDAGGTSVGSYTKGDMIYADSTNSYSNLNVAQCPNILISDDTGNVSWTDDISYYYDDFIYFSTSGTINWPWSVQTSGGTAATVDATAEHPGIMRLETSTSSSAKCALLKSASTSGNYKNIIPGGGVIILDAIVRLPNLSTASEEYNCAFGLMEKIDVSSGYPGTDGIWMFYDRTTATYWKSRVKSSGSFTDASGGSNVTVDTSWTHLRIVINAAATSVEFFVDGTSCGTCTSNIPSGTLLGTGFFLEKTAGTTNRKFAIDCFRFYNKLTTSRFS